MNRTALAGASCIAMQLVGCGLPLPGDQVGPALTKIFLANWQIEIHGGTAVRVPAYFALDEQAGAPVVEIAWGAEKKEPSLIALVRHQQDVPIAFVGGSLTSSKHDLLSITVALTNIGPVQEKFTMGDIRLVQAGGKALPIIGVSRWDSPLILKSTDRSLDLALAQPVEVNPTKRVRLNYCFAATADSYPLTLHFGTAKTGQVLRRDAELPVPQQEKQGGFSVSLAGVIRVDSPIPLEKYRASNAKGEPSIQFESAMELKEGWQIPASGPRSLTTSTVSGLFNGEKVHEEIPVIELHDGDSYVAGKISFLRQMTPIRASASASVPDVIFASSFKAEPGDVLGATASDLADGWRSTISRRKLP